MAATPPPGGESDDLASLLAGFAQEELFEISRTARLELARQCARAGDVLGWGRCLFPEKFPLPFCPELHQYLVDNRKEELTSDEAPRGYAKSLIYCFLVQMFQACEEPESFRYYLNVQSTLPKALAVNTAMKIEFEVNEELKELYGDLVGVDRWTDQGFCLRNGVYFMAMGAGQSIRGINYRAVRPSFIVVDDLYDEADANNPEATLKKNEWFWGSLYPARAVGVKTAIHVLGTAMNLQDLMHELKSKPDWKTRTFKAVKNWDTKEVLWPERQTYDELMAELRNMPSTIWYRERQNERRDEASAIVKRSWLYPGDGTPSWEFDPAELKFDGHHLLDSVLLNVDPSIGAKSENDFTGMALVYKTRFRDSLGAGGNRWYIMGLWNEHLSLDKRIELMERINANQPINFKIRQARIEGIGGFKDFVAEVKRRTNLPVQEISFVKDKLTTLESKSHFFENRKVFLNKNIAPDLKDMLVTQLCTNHPAFDDLRDAVLLPLDDAGKRWSFVG